MLAKYKNVKMYFVGLEKAFYEMLHNVVKRTNKNIAEDLARKLMNLYEESK